MLKLYLAILCLLGLLVENTACKYEKITVVGKAFRSKGSAIVHTDEGRIYVLDKPEEWWDTSVIRKRVKVTGRLKTEFRPNQDLGSGNSLLSAQVRSGTVYIILNPKWSLVK